MRRQRSITIPAEMENHVLEQVKARTTAVDTWDFSKYIRHLIWQDMHPREKHNQEPPVKDRVF